jgi:hypothetical protein
MNAIGGVGWDWGLNRNLWIFIRNAVEQRHLPRPLLDEPIAPPQNTGVPGKDGHIDVQA